MEQEYTGTLRGGTAAEAARVPKATLLELLHAMRPYQWPKNVLVFAALAFTAGDAWTPGDPGSWWPLLWRTSALFGLWCLASSGIYLLNDIRDREVDQVHPRKRLRPIASGAVSVRLAATTAVALWVVTLPAGIALDREAGAILAGYVLLMNAYSIGLKSVAVLDVIILAGGVLTRAVAGAAAIDVEVSPWLYVCTSFAAFFFASSKRWAEWRQFGGEIAAEHRPALARYSSELLTQMVGISAATALLAYALYTIEAETVPRSGAMAITLPFVAFALFRYLLLLSGPRRTEAPDRILFTDPQLIVAALGFVVTAVTVLVIERT
jgi:decaprenyl-phosphate phosphoribosyltransferase